MARVIEHRMSMSSKPDPKAVATIPVDKSSNNAVSIFSRGPSDRGISVTAAQITGAVPVGPIREATRWLLALGPEYAFIA